MFLEESLVMIVLVSSYFPKYPQIPNINKNPPSVDSRQICINIKYYQILPRRTKYSFPKIPKYQISIKITKCRQHPGDLAINHILLSSLPLSPIPQTLDKVPIQVFLSATSFYPGEWVSRFCGLTACWIALWIIILSEGRKTRRSLKIRKIQDLIKEQLKWQKMLSWIMMMIMLITTRSGSRRVVPPHKSGSGEECLATQPQASQQYHPCHRHHHHHL